MISIECDKISAHGYCSAELDMYRNGEYYANIAIISIELQDESSATHREDISTELNSVPEGTYTFKLSFYPDGRANFMERVWLSDIAVTAIYTTDQKRFKFGLNGIIAFYDKFKYLYLNEADGKVFFSIAGETDMPGVLAAYSVLYNGSTKNEWGGKINTLKKTKRISLGNYDIYHTIGHINYMVTANVVNSSGTYICMIGQKNNDSVKIVIKDLANNLSDQNFDIVITGSNV